eukprot:gene17512-biopygen17708
MTKFVFATSASVFFRVMTSHFSGVVTIKCESLISFLVSCASPVHSFTTMLNADSFFEKFVTISCASAFIGATYIILNSSFISVPSGVTCLPISCSIVSNAQTVLPAPVGAEMSTFSEE